MWDFQNGTWIVTTRLASHEIGEWSLGELKMHFQKSIPKQTVDLAFNNNGHNSNEMRVHSNNFSHTLHLNTSLSAFNFHVSRVRLMLPSEHLIHNYFQTKS